MRLFIEKKGETTYLSFLLFIYLIINLYYYLFRYIYTWFMILKKYFFFNMCSVIY